MNMNCTLSIYSHKENGEKALIAQGQNMITANGIQHLLTGYGEDTNVFNTLGIGSNAEPTVFEDNGPRAPVTKLFAYPISTGPRGEIEITRFIPEAGQIWQEFSIGHTVPGTQDVHWFNRIVLDEPFDTTEYLNSVDTSGIMSIHYIVSPASPTYLNTRNVLNINGTDYNLRISSYINDDSLYLDNSRFYRYGFQLAKNKHQVCIVGGRHEALNIPGRIFKDTELNGGNAVYRLEFHNPINVDLHFETFAAHFGGVFIHGVLEDGAEITLAPGQTLKLTFNITASTVKFQQPVGPLEVGFGGSYSQANPPIPGQFVKTVFPLYDTDDRYLSLDQIRKVRLVNKTTQAVAKTYYSSEYVDPVTGENVTPSNDETELTSNSIRASAVPNGFYDVEYDYGDGVWQKQEILIGEGSSSYTYPEISAIVYQPTDTSIKTAIKLSNALASAVYVELISRQTGIIEKYDIQTDPDGSKYIVLPQRTYQRLASTYYGARYGDNVGSTAVTRPLYIDIPNRVIGAFIGPNNRNCFILENNSENISLGYISTDPNQQYWYSYGTTKSYMCAIAYESIDYAQKPVGTLGYLVPGTYTDYVAYPAGTMTGNTYICNLATTASHVNEETVDYPSVHFILPPADITVDRDTSTLSALIPAEATRLIITDEVDETKTAEIPVTPGTSFSEVIEFPMFASKFYTIKVANAEGVESKSIRIRGYQSSIVPMITDGVYNGTALTYTFTRPAIDVISIEVRRWGFALYKLDLTDGVNTLHLVESLDPNGQYEVVCIDENGSESEPVYIFGEKPNDIVIKPENTEPSYTVAEPELSGNSASGVVFRPDITLYEPDENGKYWWDTIEWKATLNDRPATVTVGTILENTGRLSRMLEMVITNDNGESVYVSDMNISQYFSPEWAYSSAQLSRRLKLKLWHDWKPFDGNTESMFHKNGRSDITIFGQGTGYVQSTEVQSGYIRRSIVLDTNVVSTNGSCPANFDHLLGEQNIPSTAQMRPYAIVYPGRFSLHTINNFNSISVIINGKSSTLIDHVVDENGYVTQVDYQNEDGLIYTANTADWAWSRKDREQFKGNEEYVDIIDTIQFCSTYQGYNWSNGYAMNGISNFSSLSFDVNVRHLLASSNDWMSVKAWVRPYMVIDQPLDFSHSVFTNPSGQYGRAYFDINENMVDENNPLMFTINGEPAVFSIVEGDVYSTSSSADSEPAHPGRSGNIGTVGSITSWYQNDYIRDRDHFVHMPFFPTNGVKYEEYRNTLVNKDDYLTHGEIMAIVKTGNIFRNGVQTDGSSAITTNFKIAFDLSLLTPEQRLKKILIPFVSDKTTLAKRNTAYNNNLLMASVIKVNGTEMTPEAFFINEYAKIVAADVSDAFFVNHNHYVNGHAEIDASTGGEYVSSMTSTVTDLNRHRKFTIMAKDTWTQEENDTLDYPIVLYSSIVGGDIITPISYPMRAFQFNASNKYMFDYIYPGTTWIPTEPGLVSMSTSTGVYTQSEMNIVKQIPEATGDYAICIGLSVAFVYLMREVALLEPDAVVFTGYTMTEFVDFLDTLIEGADIIGEVYVIKSDKWTIGSGIDIDVSEAISFSLVERPPSNLGVIKDLHWSSQYFNTVAAYSYTSKYYPPVPQIVNPSADWYKTREMVKQLESENYTLQMSWSQWSVVRGERFAEDGSLKPITVCGKTTHYDEKKRIVFTGNATTTTINGYSYNVLALTFNHVPYQQAIHYYDTHAVNYPKKWSNPPYTTDSTLGGLIWRLAWVGKLHFKTPFISHFVDFMVNDEYVQFIPNHNLEYNNRTGDTFDELTEVGYCNISDGARLVVKSQYGVMFATIENAPVKPAIYNVRIVSSDNTVYSSVFHRLYDHGTTALSSNGMSVTGTTGRYVNIYIGALAVWDTEGNFPTLDYPDYTNIWINEDTQGYAADLYTPTKYYASSIEDFAANYFVDIDGTRAVISSNPVPEYYFNGTTYTSAFEIKASVNGVTITYVMVPELGCVDYYVAFDTTSIDNVLVTLVCTRTIINDTYDSHRFALGYVDFDGTEYSTESMSYPYGTSVIRAQDIFYTIAGATRVHNENFIDESKLISDGWMDGFNVAKSQWEIDVQVEGVEKFPIVAPEEGYVNDITYLPVGIDWSNPDNSKFTIIKGDLSPLYIDKIYSYNTSGVSWDEYYSYIDEFELFQRGEVYRENNEPMTISSTFRFATPLVDEMTLYYIAEHSNDLFHYDSGSGGEAMSLEVASVTPMDVSTSQNSTTYYKAVPYAEDYPADTALSEIIDPIVPFTQWWTTADLPVGTFAKAYTLVNSYNGAEATMVAIKLANASTPQHMRLLNNEFKVRAQANNFDKESYLRVVRLRDLMAVTSDRYEDSTFNWNYERSTHFSISFPPEFNEKISNVYIGRGAAYGNGDDYTEVQNSNWVTVYMDYLYIESKGADITPIEYNNPFQTTDLEYVDFKYSTPYIRVGSGSLIGGLDFYMNGQYLTLEEAMIEAEKPDSTLLITRDVKEKDGVEYESYYVINRLYNPSFTKPLNTDYEEYVDLAKVMTENAFTLSNHLDVGLTPRTDESSLATIQAVGIGLEYIMSNMSVTDLTLDILNAIYRPLTLTGSKDVVMHEFSNLEIVKAANGTDQDIIRFDFDNDVCTISYEYVIHPASELPPINGVDLSAFPNLKPYTLETSVVYKQATPAGEEPTPFTYLLTTNTVIRSSSTYLQYFEPVFIMPRSTPMILDPDISASLDVYNYPGLVTSVLIYEQTGNEDLTWEAVLAHVGHHTVLISPSDKVSDANYIATNTPFKTSLSKFYGIQPVSTFVKDIVYIPSEFIAGSTNTWEAVLNGPDFTVPADLGYYLDDKQLLTNGLPLEMLESVIGMVIPDTTMLPINGAKVTNTTTDDITVTLSTNTYLSVMPPKYLSWVDMDGTGWTINNDGGVTFVIKPNETRIIKNIYSFVPHNYDVDLNGSSFNILRYILTINGNNVNEGESILETPRSVAVLFNSVEGLTAEPIHGIALSQSRYSTEFSFDIVAETLMSIDPIFLNQDDRVSLSDDGLTLSINLPKSQYYSDTSITLPFDYISTNIDGSLSYPVIKVNGEELPTVQPDMSLAGHLAMAINGEKEDTTVHVMAVHNSPDAKYISLRPSVAHGYTETWRAASINLGLYSTLGMGEDGSINFVLGTFMGLKSHWADPGIVSVTMLKFTTDSGDPLTWTLYVNNAEVATINSEDEIAAAFSLIDNVEIPPFDSMSWVLPPYDNTDTFDVEITLTHDRPYLEITQMLVDNTTYAYNPDTRTISFIIEPDMYNRLMDEYDAEQNGGGGVVVA